MVSEEESNEDELPDCARIIRAASVNMTDEEADEVHRPADIRHKKRFWNRI